MQKQVNPYHAAGAPEPVQGRGGVWLVYGLHGFPIGYLVGEGQGSRRPLAMVFGSDGGCLINKRDWKLAKTIAQSKRVEESAHVFDLRLVANGEAPIPSWLLSVVLVPAGCDGKDVPGSDWEGSMYIPYEGRLAMWTAIAGAARIPWERGADKIPRELQTKNGGLMPVTHSPGQCESHKATATAA